LANALYFGDNLEILREHIAKESVDLIYLDPPFNSNANYNVLFKSPKGGSSHAQIEAFEDTWHWGPEAEQEFAELLHQPNTEVAEMIQALRKFLGENDMMAYLVMMANRLLELRRVLKPTGSLYLHCDPTASHYLKIVLDGVFGAQNFRNEISWKRSSAHSDTKQGMKRCGKIRDVILFYSKGDEYTWNPIYTPYSAEYLESEYRHLDAQGKRYKESDLTAAKPGGDTEYDWNVKRRANSGDRWEADIKGEFRKPKKGWEYLAVRPYQGRYWAYSKDNLVQFVDEGRIIHRETGIPRLKHYADEMPGISLQDIWDDIVPASGGESLGYPTQKPLALLERIIQASSNEGDVVLDPFCGCGTAVHAAEKLKRQWIGIDITNLAISLIEKRLRDAFPGIAFEVHGTPKDSEGAKRLAELDKYQFQWWACSLVNAQPWQGKKKGADSGIDGIIYFQDDNGPPKKIVVSVKGGENVGVPMIRDLAAVVAREKAEIGLFVTLAAPTKPMSTEATKAGFYNSPAGASFPKIQILTVESLLEGNAKPIYPDLAMGGHTFKKAKVDQGEQKQGKLL
jgi:adenine specific DNA methylase Mod